MDDNKVPSYLTIALCHDKSIEVENLSKKKKTTNLPNTTV